VGVKSCVQPPCNHLENMLSWIDGQLMYWLSCEWGIPPFSRFDGDIRSSHELA